MAYYSNYGNYFRFILSFYKLIILKIVSFILGDHFNLYGIWFAVIVAICISMLNVILDMTLFKRLTFKEE